jgi:hypothetical protein
VPPKEVRNEWMVMLMAEKETWHEMMGRAVEASISCFKLLHQAIGDCCFAWGIASDDSGFRHRIGFCGSTSLDSGLASYTALSGLSELDLGFLAWSHHGIPADLPHPGPICQVQLIDGEFAFDDLDDE